MQVSVIAVFSAVIGTAYSLQCIRFQLPDAGGYAVSHEGTVMNCSSTQDVCMMTYYIIVKYSFGVKSGVQYTRQCGKSSDCNLTGSMTTAGYYMSFSSTCCKTDNCLPTIPSLPERKADKNGITCPACHSENQGPCVPDRAVACTGEETHCVSLNQRTFNALTIYSSGCGSKNIFLNNGAIINSADMFSTIKVTETVGTHTLSLGNVLWCHVCFDPYFSSCEDSRHLCHPDDNVCVSEIRKTMHEESRRLTSQTLRRCGKSRDCDFEGTVSSLEKIVSVKTTCCNSHMCTNTEPVWALKRKKKNGRKCLMCNQATASNCQSFGMLECTDDETHCIQYFTSTQTHGQRYDDMYYGCASDGICKNPLDKNITIPNIKFAMTNNILCSQGIRLLYHPFSLVITKITAISLAKV